MRKLVVLLLLLSSPLLAQNTTIRGRVTMPDGNGLPGVSVTAEGTSATTMTDAEGRYSLAVPSQGVVKVTASLQGFTTKSATLDARGAGVTHDFVLHFSCSDDKSRGAAATRRVVTLEPIRRATRGRLCTLRASGCNIAARPVRTCGAR